MIYKMRWSGDATPRLIYKISKLRKFLDKQPEMLEICFQVEIKLRSTIAGLLFLLEILSSICVVIICCPFFDVKNFEISVSFLIKQFPYMIEKSQARNADTLGTKRAFNP